MASTKVGTQPRYTRKDFTDFHHTGPGTLAGRYLRTFWQPVYHSEELKPGHAKPIRIMGQDFTLYRGESGEVHMLDPRCAHRGMQLSPGWVEGDCIRCFYHGWKYDGSGQCVEQPAEPKPFVQKVRIGSYPVREYLGLIFAYMGEGEPPEFPRYQDFEEFDGFLEWDSYYRPCNYFNNLENGIDQTHSGFVHRNNPGSFDGYDNSPVLEAVESEWGVTVYARFPKGGERVVQQGMPNLLHHKAQPAVFEILPFREFLAWWVPIDDESHIQFTVAALRLPPDKAEEYKRRRAEKMARRTVPKEEFIPKILSGEMHISEVDPEVTDLVRLQDDIAQAGQGVIADHSNERLGRGDVGIILIRKLWRQELQAVAEGKPVRRWRYDLEGLPVFRDVETVGRETVGLGMR